MVDQMKTVAISQMFNQSTITCMRDAIFNNRISRSTYITPTVLPNDCDQDRCVDENVQP